VKFEVWPNTEWSKCPSIELMNRSYLLPRTWFVNARIYLDWNPSSTEVFV